MFCAQILRRQVSRIIIIIINMNQKYFIFLIVNYYKAPVQFIIKNEKFISCFIIKAFKHRIYLIG